jgi:hypothetical protein
MNSYEDEMLQRVERPTWFKAPPSVIDHYEYCWQCHDRIKPGEIIREIEKSVTGGPDFLREYYLHHKCDE